MSRRTHQGERGTKTDRLGFRDAQAEATHIAGREWRARVLEPSPPANSNRLWFADDPVTVDGPISTAGRAS